MTAPTTTSGGNLLQAREQTGFNLLAAAIVNNNVDWRSLDWSGEQCPVVDTLGFCELGGEFVPPGSVLGRYRPGTYRVTDECSTRQSYDSGRITRMADAAASYAIATELWAGAAAKRNPYPNQDGTEVTNLFLASTDAEELTEAGTVADKLGYLEERARRQSAGQPVFLHLAIRNVLALGNVLRVEGNTLKTPTGATVVADAGYTGSGPDGTDGNYAYATGPVAVGMSPVAVVDDPAMVVNRENNTRAVWADRAFYAVFDPCCHFAINLGT